MSYSKILLPEFESEMKKTRSLLERVPDGKGDFKPHEKSMPLQRLASHVAELPGWARTTLDTELLEMEPGFQPQIFKTREELLKVFDKNVADALERIRAATEEDWKKTWTFKYAGQVYMSQPRTEVMRESVLNHLIHHRAQLGVYLRLNNVEIPGMYGPSADDPAFLAAKA